MIVQPSTRAIMLGAEPPLRLDFDGSIVDARNREICVVDPNCERRDDIVEALAKLIVEAVNAYVSADA